MPPVATPFEDPFNLNTRLFLNCLDGIDDETGRRRPNDRTNSMTFIAVHVLDARHFLARCLGLEVDNPFNPLLADVERIEDVKSLPSVDELKSSWLGITGALEKRIATVAPADLAQPSPQPFPLECGDTVLGALTFLLQHEAFHIGQMALIRKYVGAEAMVY